MVMSLNKVKITDLQPDKIAYSHDGTMVAGCWVSGHHEDRYEDVTDYTACVWDQKSEKIIYSEQRRDDYDYETTKSRGSGSIHAVTFSEDDRFLLINGGKVEADRVLLPDRT